LVYGVYWHRGRMVLDAAVPAMERLASGISAQRTF
jgi:hypothetical protein